MTRRNLQQHNSPELFRKLNLNNIRKREKTNKASVTSPIALTPQSPQTSNTLPYPETPKPVPESSSLANDQTLQENDSSADPSPSPSKSYSSRPVRSFSSTNQYGERKNNIQHIVSEIRIRARNHHSRRTENGRRDSNPTNDGIFQMYGKRRKSCDKQMHPNFTNWLNSKGNLFSRHQPVYTDHNTDSDASNEPASSPSESENNPQMNIDAVPSSSPSSPVSDFTTPSSLASRGSPPVIFRPQFPKTVMLFGGKRFNNESVSTDPTADGPSSIGDLGGMNERFLASAKMVLTRRLDWKKPTNILRRVRSWSNVEQEVENSMMSPRQHSQDNQSLQIEQLNEQVQTLQSALTRAELELCQLRAQTENNRRETRMKMKELTDAHTSLRDTQELTYLNALDVINDNQKVLGYVESSYDYVLSIVGSGRQCSSGLRRHLIKALHYLGDNTIEVVFKITRFAAGVYASLRRIKQGALDDGVDDGIEVN